MFFFRFSITVSNLGFTTFNVKTHLGHTLLHLACMCYIPDRHDSMNAEDGFMDAGEDFTGSEARPDTFVCGITDMTAIIDACNKFRMGKYREAKLVILNKLRI